MIGILSVLCVLAATAFGFYEPGLKVRFDYSCSGIGTAAFIELPQSNTSASASGWVQKTRPDGPSGLSSLVMWCPDDDYTICVLFDNTGYVAGIQIAFDQEIVSNAVYNWTVQGFTNWTTTLNGTSKDYYTTQQYYISSDTLAEDTTTRIAARNSSLLLQDGYLWVSGINGVLYKISTVANDITGSNSIFTKQQCIARMGYHYYYNMTTSLECINEDMFPWFPLVDHDQLIGVGFNLFAQYIVTSGSKIWFEYSGETALRYTVPNGPECLYELGRNGGQVTLHTYFIVNPYDVTCLAK